MSVLTLIMAAGEASRLSVLGEERPPSALPFGGKYRIIDVALSNAVNSELQRVAVLTEQRSHALITHLGAGAPWGLNRRRPDGLQIWRPGQGRHGQRQYSGTADALYQNRLRIADSGSELLLLLSGEHIYKQDYRDLLRFHHERAADLTVATMQVRAGEGCRFGSVSAGADARITACGQGPGRSGGALASIGVYVFSTALLLQCLEEDHRDEGSSHDLGGDIIPRMLGRHRLFAYPFSGAWADLGTVAAYWSSNLELLEGHAPLDLYDSRWVIHTHPEERPPVKFGACGDVDTSLLSGGCVIDGTVINSILSPGVRVERGAIVRNSVVMSDATIRAGSQVDRCVLDQEVEIGVKAQVGVGDEQARDDHDPGNLNSGITVLGRRAQVPAGALIGRNCRIDPYVTAEEFERRAIPSGATVSRARSPAVEQGRQYDR